MCDKYTFNSAQHSSEEKLLENVVISKGKNNTPARKICIAGLIVSVLANLILLPLATYYIVEFCRNFSFESLLQNNSSSQICNRGDSGIYFGGNATCKNGNEHLVAKNGTFVKWCFIAAPAAYIYLINVILSSRKVSKSVASRDSIGSTEVSRKYQHFILNVEKKEGLRFQSDVRTENATIERDGWHVVYSQVTLRTMGDGSGSTIQHSILLSNDNKGNTTTTELMSDQVSGSSKHMSYKSNLMLSTFYLRKGDSLYQSISDVGILYGLSSTNYWGFYLL